MVNKAFYKSTDCGAGIHRIDKKAEPYPTEITISLRTMSPSMVEEVQCNQPAIKWLEGTIWPWCHISGSQIRLSEGHFIHGCIGQVLHIWGKNPT